MIRDAPAEAQAAVQPLIPYFDTLNWLFISTAQVGTAVPTCARWDGWNWGRR